QRDLPACDDSMVFNAPMRNKEDRVDIRAICQRFNRSQRLRSLRVAIQNLIERVRIVIRSECASNPSNIESSDTGNSSPFAIRKAAVPSAHRLNTDALKPFDRSIDACTGAVERVIVACGHHAKTALL